MMQGFKVYPHKGYLNTSFCFCSEEDCQIVDEFDMSEITLKKGVCKNMRLAPGLHKFTHTSESCCEEIVVEDALRFGGSTVKYTFCSDVSPWVVCVMKDRMYFHNTRTNEEYFENGISPDSVCGTNGGYLIFQSKNNSINTLYSCDDRKEVEQFDHLIYNQGGILIFTRNRGDLIEVGHYRIGNDGHIRGSLEKCSEYSIYGRHIYLRGMHNEYLITPFENPILTSFNPISEDTLCMLKDSPYALVCGTCNERFVVKVMDVRDGNTYAVQSFNEHIEMINSHVVMSLDKINHLYGKAKEICNHYPRVLHIAKTYSKLNYFVWNEKVFCLKLTVIESSDSNQKTFISYKTQCIALAGMNVIFETDQLIGLEQISWTTDRLYIQENNSSYSIVEYDTLSVIRKTNIRIYPYNDSLILAESKEDSLFIYKEDGTLLLETRHKLDFSLLEYGVICDNTDNVFLHLNCCDNEYRRINYVSYLQKKDWLVCRIKDQGVEFISSSNDEPLECPFNIEFISCCCSPKGNTLVGFDNGEPRIYKCLRDSYELLSNPWEGLFDSSQCSNAWFDDVGNCFIYDSNERVYKYYNCETDSIEIFEAPHYVTRNENLGVNAYHPLMEYRNQRRPVFKDPNTLQSINSNDLRSLSFMSPDGRYLVENDYLIKYTNKVTEEEIPIREFLRLSDQYDCSSSPNAAIVERRKQFVREHKQYFETYKDIDSFVCHVSNFTEYFVKTHKYLLMLDTVSGKNLEFEISNNMNFLNYVSFSFDSKYMAIAGLLGSNGIVEVFDVVTQKSVHHNRSTRAVWLVSFNKNNNVAYYTSSPDTNIVPFSQFLAGECKEGQFSHPNRSFLTFSPTGHYFALSKQGYTSSESNPENWGHNPCCDVYIHAMSKPDVCLAHYNDHGDKIVGVSEKAKSVAAVAFSPNEKRLLSVSNDGVVVVRNLFS